MKRLNQNGFGLLAALIISAVVASLGIVAWQVAKNYKPLPKTGSPIAAEHTSNDCGGNTKCFFQAFNNSCSQKTVKTSRTTIEGDQIITKAKITSSNQGCLLEVIVDGSHDKFGDGKVHTYMCKKLANADENQLLTASECTGSTQTLSVDI